MRQYHLRGVLCVLALAAGGGLNAADPVKILLIGKQPDHPFGTHMYLHTQRLLAACVELTEGVETVLSDGWPEDPAVRKNVRAVVVYSSPAAEFLLDGPGADQLHQMMQHGVGLVTIHWASSVYEKNLERLGDRWLDYLGGTWVSNYGLSTDTALLQQVHPDHPVCRGWQPYDLHDELYLKPVIRAATPVLQVQTHEQQVVVGWAHERSDGGRAYATTLGHFYSNFQIPAFRRAIVNGILWAAHVDIPVAGAPVDVGDEYLQLPPDPDGT